MAQITNGIRAVLSHPAVYESFQTLMGAKRIRTWTVKAQIRPFAGMRILDLGCGTAEILHYLPDKVTYVGYDMSQEYIDAAKRKFGSRGEFHCRLLEQAEVATLEKFDLVLGIGVLHHLDDANAKTFMEIAKGALKSGGRVITLDPVYAKGQNPVAKFLISRDRGQNVRDAAGYESVGKSVFTNVHGIVNHQKWIPYTHFIMECVA